MTLKKWSTFFKGDSFTSLNISIDGLQLSFMYQLRVKRGPQDFSLGLPLVELV